MNVFLLYGWHGVPGGVKPTHLNVYGHIAINPTINEEFFEAAVRAAQAEFDQQQPDVTVSSSRDPVSLKTRLVEDSKRFHFKEVAFDGYNFEETRQTFASGHGIEISEVPTTMQGIGEATVHFERFAHEGKLAHNGNPILTWNVQNCAVKTDNRDRIMIDRDKTAGRYDGVSAALVALNRYLATPRYSYSGLTTLPA